MRIIVAILVGILGFLFASLFGLAGLLPAVAFASLLGLALRGIAPKTASAVVAGAGLACVVAGLAVFAQWMDRSDSGACSPEREGSGISGASVDWSWNWLAFSCQLTNNDGEKVTFLVRGHP